MISSEKTVDAFFRTLSAPDRAVLSRLRTLLTADAAVVESMKYRMPTYEIGANMVGGLNRQKNYLALYLNPAAVDPHRTALKAAKLDCGKSCIRFKRPEQLPLGLATKMIAAAIALAKG